MNVESDPWEEARWWLEQCRASTDVATKRQIAFVDHLNDEINRLTKRVANLEKASEIVRRLAENEEMSADEWVRLIVDAKELWAKMKGGEE